MDDVLAAKYDVSIYVKSLQQWIGNSSSKHQFICIIIHRYEAAREEEKLRNQKEDFSDMVAEVCFRLIFFTIVNPYQTIYL